ncbi:DNA polymerase III subunit delta [bacterium]|nr:DNA polymerase III subunit delta [bacterium]
MADNKNIYILIGEEVLKEGEIEALIKKYAEGEFKEFNLDILKGKETSSTSILQRAHTPPIGAKFRLIVVRDFGALSEGEQKKLAESLETIPRSTILILSVEKKEELSTKLREKLRKLKDFVVEKSTGFKGKKWEMEQQKREWVQKELRKRNIKIAPDALNLLLSLPLDTRQLLIEIEKLSTYAQGDIIRREDVENLVVGTEDIKTYHLVDAVFYKNAPEAMRFLYSLLETGDIWTPLVILHSLVSHTRLLIQTKLLQERGIPLNKISIERAPSEVKDFLLQGNNGIVNYIEKRNWLIKRLEEQAMRFSKRSLYSILRFLHRIDMEIKQGADPKEKLEYFIFKVAGLSPYKEEKSIS